MALDPVTSIAKAIESMGKAMTQWFSKVDVRNIIKSEKRMRRNCDRAVEIFNKLNRNKLPKKINKEIDEFFEDLLD